MAVVRAAQSIKSGNGSTFDHSKASAALNVPAGALIVVKFSTPQSGNITTAPTDTAGNTYTLAKSQSASNNQSIWYCLNATANAANVVTSAFSQGCSEYGYSVEVYTGGTWTYDSTNSGTAAGAFSTTALSTPSLATTGAGVIGTVFGQYNYPVAGNTATQTPGSVVNSGGDGTTVVMASGEVINSSAFSGTISVNINTATPSNTKLNLTYASFLSSGGGGSTDSASVTSTLGALATVATTAAAVAVAASCGMGGFSCNAGISAVMAAQEAGALPPLASSVVASASQASSVTGAIGALASAITVSAINANTASVISALGALAASGTMTFSQSAALASQTSLSASLLANAMQGVAASGQIGPLSSSLTVNSINVNTAVITATLGALASQSAVAQSMAANALYALTLASSGQIGASQAVSVWATLPSFWTSIALSTQNVAQIHSTLGPLSSAITIQPPPAGYAADGNYYVALPARPFYATLPSRSFYSALPSRSFYILSNQNMTPTFSNLDPRETEVLTFDASNDLANGETLTNIESVAITVQSGPSTATPPTLTGQIVNGAPVTLTVNGKTITIATGCCVQVVGTGGVANCSYLIAITCATSNPDKVLTLKAILPVTAQ